MLPQFQRQPADSKGPPRRASEHMAGRHYEEAREGENSLLALRRLRQGDCEFDRGAKTNDKARELSVCPREGMSCMYTRSGSLVS